MSDTLPPRATIDFESRSACPIRKTGSWRYSCDPTTEPLCLAFRLPYWEEGRTGLWHPAFPTCDMEASDDDLAELFLWIMDGELVEAHNAWFERGIWTNIMAPRFGWPEVPHRSWRCSAAKAAAHALPRSLDAAVEALDLPLSKDKEGSAVMKKMAKPRKPRKAEVAAWQKAHGVTPMPLLYFESPELFGALFAYCRQDVLAEEALSLALDDLSPEETEVFLLDHRVNERGFQLDMAGVRRALTLITTDTQRLNTELCELTGGSPSKATQRAKMQAWFAERGLTLPDTQKATIADALDGEGEETDDDNTEETDVVTPNAPLCPEVKRALTILQTLSLSSTAKFEAMNRWACPDGRVRGGMLYHGAGTGRWSGAGVQPHNFPKGCFKESEHPMSAIWDDVLARTSAELEATYDTSLLQVLSHALRGAIVASPGKHLFVADYASIEVRVLLWLAQDETHLAMLRKGVDMYVDMASKIYGRKLTPKDKTERQLGKAAVLGCFGSDTLVLTDQGWVPIVDVTVEHKVWDGDDWVAHEGCVYQGVRSTVSFDGLHVTPDHLMLLEDQWVPARRFAPRDALELQMPVFDLVNTGPRHRFTVWSTQGPRIVHNCGYQMGGPKFMATAQMYGVPIEEDFAQTVVKTYREEYRLVCDLWYKTERGAMAAVESPGRAVTVGRVTYIVEDPRFLFCYLPSGRRLSYPFPEIQERMTSWGAVKSSVTFMGVDTMTQKWTRQHTYGGCLVENNTQAVARDLMAEALVRAEASGIYAPVLSVHDELICEAHPLLGDVREFEHILTTVPSWATGCPIAAEGWSGPRYHK